MNLIRGIWTGELKDKSLMHRSRELIGINIRRLAKRPGYSIAGLREALGISKSQMSHYMTGRRFPGTENLDLIAKYFKVDISELFLEEITDKPDVKVSVDDAMRVVADALGFKVEKVKKP